ncbi:hypothetical protein FRC01_009302, partial [Tulasnella sp. 417]
TSPTAERTTARRMTMARRMDPRVRILPMATTPLPQRVAPWLRHQRLPQRPRVWLKELPLPFSLLARP